MRIARMDQAKLFVVPAMRLLALLLLAAPALGACPPATHCSWTRQVTWTPAVPATFTAVWRATPDGPVDHTLTYQTLGPLAEFEVENGTWYVTITLSAPQITTTSGTFKCVDDSPCVQIGIPSAPTGFTIT